jgi:MFS family permease
MTDYNSNIWKLYIFYFFSALEFTLAIYTLFLLDNGLSMTEIMILESIFTITIFAFEVPSGAFADRIGRKWALFLSTFLASIAWLTFGFGTTFWIFLLAQIFIGLAWAFSSGADSAFIYDTLKELKREKEYDKMFGIFYFIDMFTLGVVGVISGFLATIMDYKNLFFITSFLFFIASLVSLTLKEPPIHKHLQEKNYFNHLKKAVKFSINHKIIRNLIIYFGTYAALAHLAYFIIQPYYKDAGFSELILGIAISAYFMFLAIGGLFAHKIIKRFKEKSLLFSLLLITGVSLIALYFSNKYIAIFFIGLITFTEGIRNVFIGKEIDSHHRATVISVKSMSKSVIYAFAAPIIGLVTDIYTPEASLLMLGIGMLIFLVYIIWLFGWNSKEELKSRIN